IARSAAARLLEEYYKILRAGRSERTFRHLAELGLVEPISTELHEGASDALWRSLAHLDAYRQTFDTVPQTLPTAMPLRSLAPPPRPLPAPRRFAPPPGPPPPPGATRRPQFSRVRRGGPAQGTPRTAGRPAGTAADCAARRRSAPPGARAAAPPAGSGRERES